MTSILSLFLFEVILLLGPYYASLVSVEDLLLISKGLGIEKFSFSPILECYVMY